MARRRLAQHIPTLAYLRVSTSEQVDSGAGLDAQREAIDAHAVRAGLTIDAWHIDAGVSGSLTPSARPALADALDTLDAARSGVLLVAKTDRIARRAADLLALCSQAERSGWSLVAVDGSVDQTTDHGRLMTTMLAAIAEFERDLVRSRTRDALAAKRAAGMRLGRPVSLAQPVRDRIGAERAAGATLQAIADRLMSDGVLTAGGKVRWHASTVAAVLRSLDLDAEVQGRRERGQ